MIPERSSLVPIRQPCQGVALYRNPENGGVVAVFHYSADPAKRGAWADRESRLYAGGRASIEWQQEFEIDFLIDERARTYWAFEPRRNVIKPFSIPRDWPKFLGIDFGQTAPTAVIICAQNPATQAVFVVDEIYLPNAKPRVVCQLIYRKLEAIVGHELNATTLGEVLEDAVGDPSAPMFASMYAEDPWPVPVRTKGFKTQFKLNDRRQGASRVNEAFSPSFVHCGERQYPFGQHNRGRCRRCDEVSDAWPLLFILDGRAPNLVRTLPLVTKALKTREDLEEPERDEKVEDHAPDALRYAIMRTQFMAPAAETRQRELAHLPDALLDTSEILEKIRQRAAAYQSYRSTVGDDEDTLVASEFDPAECMPYEEEVIDVGYY